MQYVIRYHNCDPKEPRRNWVFHFNKRRRPNPQTGNVPISALTFCPSGCFWVNVNANINYDINFSPIGWFWMRRTSSRTCSSQKWLSSATVPSCDGRQRNYQWHGWHKVPSTLLDHLDQFRDNVKTLGSDGIKTFRNHGCGSLESLTPHRKFHLVSIENHLVSYSSDFGSTSSPLASDDDSPVQSSTLAIQLPDMIKMLGERTTMTRSHTQYYLWCLVKSVEIYMHTSYIRNKRGPQKQ